LFQPSRARRPGAPLVAVTVVVLLAGCRPKKPPELKARPAPAAPIKYDQELPPGEKALRKIPPERYPDFSGMQLNPADLVRSIDHSLEYLAAPSSQKHFPYLDVTHERAVATLRALREVASAAGKRPVDWNQEIRNRFEVYQSVGAPRPGGAGYTNQVLFTGYFTPTYPASLTRTGQYQWPLYKRPADLVTDDQTNKSYRRTADGSLVPYYTRAQIEGGKLPQFAGPQLVYLSSRWHAYVITIQGSARLRLTDGRVMEVGYAGTNGLDYASPGMKMVQDGVIPRESLSLATMKAYFDAHPEAMDKYLWVNLRMVFFTERPGGPFGSLAVPVTPLASIATDKAVYPRAMPAFVAVGRDMRRLMLDQDTGGAIRAAGRCDIYMGIGEGAEQTAGRQLDTGSLYYLAVKPG
jgi:membrane-bound lytic murein transglycosylase A